MSQDEMRRLFDVVLSEPNRDRTDLDAAIRSGRRRRRVRVGAVLVSSVAVVAVVGVWVSGSLTATPAPVVGVSSSPSATASLSPHDGTPVTRADQLHGNWRAVDLNGHDVRNARTQLGDPLLIWFGSYTAGGPTMWGADDGCNYHSGTVTVSNGGLLADGERSTLVGCVPVPYPDNLDAVKAARQARLIAATPRSSATLLLLADGRIVGVYVAVPNADRSRKGGSTLTSGPYNDPGSGMAGDVRGRLALGADGCMRLDGRTTVFPNGTTWSPTLGLLVLPDGTTAQPGQTISGAGGALTPSSAKTWATDKELVNSCTWTSEAVVFNRDASLSVRS
jgi:heat shock protein HslJ